MVVRLNLGCMGHDALRIGGKEPAYRTGKSIMSHDTVAYLHRGSQQSREPRSGERRFVGQDGREVQYQCGNPKPGDPRRSRTALHSSWLWNIISVSINQRSSTMTTLLLTRPESKPILPLGGQRFYPSCSRGSRRVTTPLLRFPGSDLSGNLSCDLGACFEHDGAPMMASLSFRNLTCSYDLHSTSDRLLGDQFCAHSLGGLKYGKHTR